jgi:hypothetical protein
MKCTSKYYSRKLASRPQILGSYYGREYEMGVSEMKPEHAWCPYDKMGTCGIAGQQRRLHTSGPSGRGSAPMPLGGRDHRLPASGERLLPGELGE